MKLIKILAAAASFAAAPVAQAGFVNFGADAPGAKPNGFVSASGGGVSFSDTLGNGLQVGDFGSQSDGLGLGVFNDDVSRLEMNFTGHVSFLELAFGNDDASVAVMGDRAWLLAFDGATQVGSASVEMNLNDVMDQTVSFGGPNFNRAEFYFGNAAGVPINLTEAVDNLRFTEAAAIPTPGSLSLLAAALLAAAARRRRK